MRENTIKSNTSKAVAGFFLAAMLGLVWFSGGLACSPVDPDEEFFSDPTCDGDPVDVAGRWTLSGEGSRSGCGNEALDTDGFQLRAAPFDVSQSGALLELASAPAVPAGGSFSFVDTSVRGACVAFTTIEENNARRIHYRWRGRVQSDGSLYGDFEGDGPSACVSQGTFSVEIK